MLRRPPNYFENTIVLLNLFGFPAKVKVLNKQQLGWFLKPGSQVSSIFHFLGFSNILQDHNSISLNRPPDFVHIFQQVSLYKGCKSVGVSYKFSPIQYSQQSPRSQLIRNQPLVSVNQGCVSIKALIHVAISLGHMGHHY